MSEQLYPCARESLALSKNVFSLARHALLFLIYAANDRTATYLLLDQSQRHDIAHLIRVSTGHSDVTLGSRARSPGLPETDRARSVASSASCRGAGKNGAVNSWRKP